MSKKKPVTVAARRHGGTHLINPLCKQLSGLKCRSADKARELFIPDGPLVVFTRDPRNIFISRFRWDLRNKGLSTAPLPDFGYDDVLAERLARITQPNHRDPKEFWYAQGMEYMLRYWGYWLGIYCQKLVTKFEVLANEETGPGEAARIGKYLNTNQLQLGRIKLHIVMFQIKLTNSQESC